MGSLKRRGLKKEAGKKLRFLDTANFRQRRLWVLKISILSQNFPKMHFAFFWATTFRQEEDFLTVFQLPDV